MSSNRIVVVGGGVIGLTTALLLSKDKSNEVTVAAKHMPGDYDIEYCSPFAGANYLPVGAEGSPLAEWEKNTWPVLKELAEKYPEAGVHFQSDYEYATANAVDPKADTKPTGAQANNRLKDANSATGQWFKELVKADPWYKDVVPDYRVVPKEQLGPGIDNGFVFTSVCINSAVYLAWLVSQCRKNGVVFKRAIFRHIADAANSHHHGKRADVVVNCTGLSSKKLGGVEDQKLYPARGQTVLVRNEINAMGSMSGCDDGEDEVCYTMMRAAGGGTILGGSYQKHNWESQPDPNLAVRIMKRCIQLNPELVGSDESGKPRGIEALSIIRHGVGLRPLREGGTRIERENIQGVSVVHNYGHGGFGYQSSYGSCSAAVRLVEEALNDIKNKARL